MGVNERAIIITGASSGIGAATALRLAGRYSGLVLHARKSKNVLERVAERVRNAGSSVRIVMGDLADETLGIQLVEAARDAWGRLDCVVANAGFPILKSFDEGTSEDIDRAFRGNVYSFLSLVRAAAPLLGQSPCARVVAVGSFTSHVFRTDIRQFPLSAASKGALEVAVRSMAMHLADGGVTVNCVVPGMIQKDAGTEDGMSTAEMAESVRKVPLGRHGHPGDVAAAIEFFLSEDASYITGQILRVDGGLA